MKLKSTFLSALLILSAAVFASNNAINAFVSPNSVCSGDTMTVIIVPTDSFAVGNIYSLSLLKESNLSTIPLGHIAGRYIDTFTFVVPHVAQNGSDYDVAVTASADGTLGGTIGTFTVHNRITASLQFPQSYCTYSQSIPLSGGSPAGGVYSGTYVQNDSFLTTQSGVGVFDVYYNILDGCTTADTAAITIITCAGPSVSVSVSPATICPGSTMTLNIQVSELLAADNVFTVQLSDSTGSFTDPTVLLYDTSRSNNIVQITAPAESPGNLYQIRVVASDPATNSVSYGVAFEALLPPPSVQLNHTGMVNLCTRDSFNLSVDSVYGVSYQWSFNGVPFSVSKYKYTARDSGQYVVAFNDTLAAGCSSGADSLFIGVYPYPAKPSISPTGTTDYCGAGTVSLSTAANNAVTFQWADHGQNIAGATQTSYAVSVTGVYLVKAVGPTGCATKSDSVHVNIHADPTVTLTLPFDSFCVNSAPIALTGGSPVGSSGFYTGSFTYGNATFNPDSSGVGSFEILYTYIDSIGCRSTDSAKVKVYNCTTLPAGINEITGTPSFEMLPNPASGRVNISTSGLVDCKMRLFNLLGQEISNQQFNAQLTYSLDKLPSGVYLVEISNLSDSWKAVKRLVVQ